MKIVIGALLPLINDKKENIRRDTFVTSSFNDTMTKLNQTLCQHHETLGTPTTDLQTWCAQRACVQNYSLVAGYSN